MGGALVPSFLPTLDIVRGVPALLGLHPTAVTIRTRVWSGGRRDKGDATDVDLQLAPGAWPAFSTPTVPTPYYKVRHVSEREIASSGARYELGAVRIGPITPQFIRTDGSTGGFTEAQLRPRVSDLGTEVIYVLTATGPGGINGEYKLVDLDRDSSLHYVVTANRMLTTP